MKILNIFLILCFTLGAYSVEAKTIRFAVGSDLHYSIVKPNSPTNAKSDAPKVLNGFIDRMNEEKPDFVMFLGDNIDKSKPDILKSFLDQIKRIKRPYYIVIGDRDSYKYSGMSREDFAKMVSTNSRYQKEYKSNYTFNLSQDVVGIVLDSTSMGMPGTHGYFSADTLSWFDKTLTKNKNKKVIVFQHVPFYEPVENESHNILNFSEYNNVYKKHKNIAAVVSGHYHELAANQDEKGVYQISAPALYESPYEYLIIEVTYDKLPLGEMKNFKLNGTKKIAL